MANSKLLSDFLEDYLVYCQTSGKGGRTLVTYRSFLGKFVRETGNPTPRQLTTKTIFAFQNSLNTYSPATRQHYAVCVRNLLFYLKKVKAPIGVDPTEIEVPKARMAEIKTITPEELDRLLKAANPLKKRDGTMRDRAIMELLASSGLRVAELCSLRVQDVNMKTREIRVINGKGGKNRLVFMTGSTVKWIQSYLDNDHDLDTPYLFYSTEGTGAKLGKLTTRTVERSVKKYASLAGINKKCTPHTLRHFFATKMLSKGADMRTTQELLGHSSILTTQRYTHVTNEGLKKAYDQANSSFATTPSGSPYKNEFVVLSKENFYHLTGQLSQLKQLMIALAKTQEKINKKLG